MKKQAISFVIKMKYYKELPNGYKEAYSIDAGNKKTGLILNLIGLPIMIVMFIIQIGRAHV